MRTLEKGFTLAEVLITLAIVGVVAALTLPNLISKINDKVAQNQASVFTAKLIKGLNLTKSQGDLNNTYSSTYDFLENGLGKNLKFAKICDSESIRDCIPYDKIKYLKKDDSEDFVYVKDLKTASKLRLGAGFEDLASFVLADGTFAIVSYNKNCIVDDGEADTNISSCLAGIYDINGSRKPNRFGTVIKDDKTVYTGDLRSFNGATLGCVAKIGNLCVISSIKKANAALALEVQAVDPNYKYTSNWQVAQDYCKIVKGGHTPSSTELADIARKLYNDESITDTGSGSGYDSTEYKDEIWGAIFGAPINLAPNNWRVELWANSRYTHTAILGYRRAFSAYGTDYAWGYDYDYRSVLCFGD